MWELNPWFTSKEDWSKKKKRILWIVTILILSIMVTRNAQASEYTKSSEIFTVTQPQKINTWRFHETVPGESYIEEIWSNGDWVQTYSTVTVWGDIYYNNGFSIAYSTAYGEKVWYKEDGTYYKRSYYQRNTYSTW